jgi:dihydrodipicolinate synthase/N-acetylneuraminate lyase
LFNAQNRAGVWLETSTIVAIAEDCENVVGLKDSSRNLVAIGELVTRLGPEFRILQGADTLIVPTLAMGGVGAVNSLAMLFPRLFVALYEAFEAGDVAMARALQLKVLPIASAVYEETNPVGLKYALDLLGLPGGPSRAPLQPISDEAAARLRAFLGDLRGIPDLEPRAGAATA